MKMTATEIERALVGEAEASLDSDNSSPEFPNLLVVKSANVWISEASQRPNPRRLFGDFWVEGECVFGFGDTGANKTTLGVQIAESIARGTSILGMACEVEPTPVLYCDFELSDKQFQKRYSEDFTNPYCFSENFKRAEFNRECILPKGLDFEELLLHSIEAEVVENNYRVILVDNITALRSKLQDAKDATPFMQELNRLKRTYDLSILVWAHTPKTDAGRPITVNDLAGSKNLSNLADATFAVGKSHTIKGLRYLKQIKARSVDEIYTTDNVVICQLEKPSNFLELRFMAFGSELEHLAQQVERVGDKTLAAEEFLKQILGDGPRLQSEVEEKSVEQGIKKGTLRIAKVRLKVKSTKNGFSGEWRWELPEPTEDANEDSEDAINDRASSHGLAPSHLRSNESSKFNSFNGLTEDANALTPSGKEDPIREDAKVLNPRDSMPHGLAPCTRCDQVCTPGDKGLCVLCSQKSAIKQEAVAA